MQNVSEFVKEKLKTSELKDVNAEKLLIACMLKFPEVIRKCIKELRDDAFSSDRCKEIYSATIEFYNDNGIVFDNSAFETFLEAKPIIERTAYSKMWRNIMRLRKKAKLANGLALIPKLEKLYQGRMIEFGLATTIEKLKKVASEGYSAIDEATKAYNNIVPMLENKSAPTFIMNPFEYYDKFKKEHKAIQKNPKLLRTIPTGLKELDDIMGGIRPSEFGLITAGTGKGKSIMLGDFCYDCWKVSGHTLYVTIEMPGSQASERVFCRMSGIPYDNFRKYKLTEDHWKRLDEKISKAKKNDYKFRILDMPQSSTVKGLRIEIEDFIRKHYEPKLILIDYMNILQGGFDWTKQIEIAVDIKQQIARYFKIATWSANQLMGSKNEKEIVKISDAAFAKNIFDNVDIGIGIGETEATEEEDIFRITFTKTRDFKGKSFLISADRSRMTFTKAKEKDDPKNVKKKQEHIGGKVV